MTRIRAVAASAACACALASCGGSTKTQTVLQTQSRTTSLTTTRTVTHHAGTLTLHVTTTETVTHTPGPVASQGHTSSNGVLTLTGQGTQNMGTVNVPSQSVLRWSCPTCSSDNFIVNNNASDGTNIAVNALNQTSGRTVIDAEAYHDFMVEGGSLGRLDYHNQSGRLTA